MNVTVTKENGTTETYSETVQHAVEEDTLLEHLNSDRLQTIYVEKGDIIGSN